ncbi:MAG: Crp/Fnr family transcriptional regulator [Candidatus Izimaplasma sp.]|nr:Crp/Fnr family transcriptional regulator [Candidatus Izimaplasma bacterium]
MTNYCNVCIYKSLPYREITIKKGAYLFHQGDPLTMMYYLRDGLVKVLKLHSNGEEKIFDIVGKNDFLALLAILQKKDLYPASAIALTDLILNVSTKADVLNAYTTNQPFKEACIDCASNRAILFQDHLFQLSNASTDDKIIGVLTHLAQQLGTFKDDIYTVDIPLNQTDLANIINVRRETLSRKLTELKKQEKITIDKNTYKLYNNKL